MSMSENITIQLSDLHERAKTRPAGYVQDVLSHAINVTADTYTLTPSAMDRLREKYATGDLACAHRRNVVEMVQCPTCAGNVQIKVHACARHNRCHMGDSPINNVKSCRACPDRAVNPVQQPTPPVVG